VTGADFVIELAGEEDWEEEEEPHAASKESKMPHRQKAQRGLFCFMRSTNFLC
jgi:hypothetical protein